MTPAVRAALLNQELTLNALAKEIDLVLDESTRRDLVLKLNDLKATTQEANEAMQSMYEHREVTK